MVFIVFKSPAIQTYITSYIAQKISLQIHAKIEIGGVDFSLFKTVILHNVYVEDRQKDTLFYIKHLEVSIKDLNLKKKVLKINDLRLWQPQCFLAQSKKGIVNLQFILDALSGDTTDTSVSKPFVVSLNHLKIVNGKFRYENLLDESAMEKGVVSFSHLAVSNISLDIRNLNVRNDSILFTIRNLSFHEKSGLTLKEFSVAGVFAPTGIYLKNLYLQTDNSTIRAPYFNLKTNTLADFSNVEQKVKFDVSFYASKVKSTDIAFFASALKGFDQHVFIAGKVKGPLASLKTKDFIFKFRQHTLVKGNFEIQGLPDISNTFFTLKFEYLKTHISDFYNFPLPPFNQGNVLEMPKMLNSLGDIVYKGELTGFTSDLVAYGNLTTALGNIKTDAAIKYNKTDKVTSIDGNVSLISFNAGRILYMEPTLQTVSLTANLKATSKGNSFKGDVKGNISSVFFNRYVYQNINVNATITEKMFDGSLNLDDPNIKLSFLGKIDFSEKQPVFNFMADVKNAKLNKLHLIPEDSIITLSFLLDSKINGDKLDMLNGSVDIYQMECQLKQKSIHCEHIAAIAQYDNSGKKKLSLTSDILDFSLEGYFQYKDLLASVQQTLKPYLPALDFATVKKDFILDKDFSVNGNLTLYKNFEMLSDFLPWLYANDGSKIIFSIAAPENIMVNINSDSIKLNTISLPKFDLTVKSENQKLFTALTSSQLYLSKNIRLKGFNTNIVTANGSNEIYAKWLQNDSIIGEGELSAVALIHSENKHLLFDITLNPSRININQNDWYINDGKISILDSTILIKEAMINQQNQYLYINGVLGNNLSDTLHVSMNQIAMNIINPFIKSSGITLDGVLNGNLFVRKALSKPVLISNFSIDKLKINNEELGKFNLLGEWDDEQNMLKFKGDAFRGKIKTLDFKGNYKPDGSIKADVSLDKWNLSVIEPFIKSFACNVKGIASGNMLLTGSLKKPILEGKVTLTKTSLTITYLNTRYNFTGDVEVTPNAFVVKSIDVYDEETDVAQLSGKVSHQYFTNVDFDLMLHTKRFLCMNTKYTDNNLFYGSVYASGLVNIKGLLDNLSINANVQTEKGTKFNLSMESTSDLTEQNFITFVDKKQLVVKDTIQKLIETGGLSLNFNIQATTDATMQLIFDSKVGDIIKAQGTGNLRLALTPNGDFSMFGNYLITKGDYLFTLKNVINKKFEIEQGSSVTFSGDPMQADLDIQAKYKLKASLYELMLDSTYKPTFPVECILSLKNKLLSPTFKFNIKIPNADSRVEGVLSSLSDEEINEQLISLLVLNSFSTPDELKGGVKTVEYRNYNPVGVNSSELLTNQLNHWLSQISKTVNLGVNYRHGNEISNEELAVALSTQILNDRITINTNLGVSNGNQTESSMLIGDFEIEAKLNKSGKLRAKGFNHTNTNIIKDTSPYTQGIGIFYREEFDSWNKLIHSYWKSIFAKKEEKPAK